MVETILEFLEFSGVDFQSVEKMQQQDMSDMSDALLVQGVFVINGM